MTDNTERLFDLRDHALALVEARGRSVASKPGDRPLRILREGRWTIAHRPPYDPGGGERVPAGLDVWHGDDGRVISIYWSRDGLMTVLCFNRGSWEAELLALSAGLLADAE